ncbi:MAG TPA: DUF3800 domain-containing protein [Candidatus Binataceae bacterium]
MLQAWFDDSGRGLDPVFLLAGYSGSIDSVENCVDEYQAVMQKPPTLTYLKGIAANALKYDFDGWTEAERDAKLCDLIGVIRKHELIALSVGVDSVAFRRILRQPKGIMKNPDALAYAHVVTWLLHSAYVIQPPEQIEFIFHQGVLSREEQIRKSYEGMRSDLPKEVMKVLVNRPRFEDNKHNLLLQAADLFAWHCRRDYEEQLLRSRRWSSRIWDELRTVRGTSIFLGQRELEAFRAQNT